MGSRPFLPRGAKCGSAIQSIETDDKISQVFRNHSSSATTAPLELDNLPNPETQPTECSPAQKTLRQSTPVWTPVNKTRADEAAVRAAWISRHPLQPRPSGVFLEGGRLMVCLSSDDEGSLIKKKSRTIRKSGKIKGNSKKPKQGTEKVKQRIEKIKQTSGETKKRSKSTEKRNKRRRKGRKRVEWAKLPSSRQVGSFNDMVGTMGSFEDMLVNFPAEDGELSTEDQDFSSKDEDLSSEDEEEELQNTRVEPKLKDIKISANDENFFVCLVKSMRDPEVETSSDAQLVPDDILSKPSTQQSTLSDNSSVSETSTTMTTASSRTSSYRPSTPECVPGTLSTRTTTKILRSPKKRRLSQEELDATVDIWSNAPEVKIPDHLAASASLRDNASPETPQDSASTSMPSPSKKQKRVVNNAIPSVARLSRTAITSALIAKADSHVEVEADSDVVCPDATKKSKKQQPLEREEFEAKQPGVLRAMKARQPIGIAQGEQVASSDPIAAAQASEETEARNSSQDNVPPKNPPASSGSRINTPFEIPARPKKQTPILPPKLIWKKTAPPNRNTQPATSNPARTLLNPSQQSSAPSLETPSSAKAPLNSVQRSSILPPLKTIRRAISNSAKTLPNSSTPSATRSPATKIKPQSSKSAKLTPKSSQPSSTMEPIKGSDVRISTSAIPFPKTWRSRASGTNPSSLPSPSTPCKASSSKPEAQTLRANLPQKSLQPSSPVHPIKVTKAPLACSPKSSQIYRTTALTPSKLRSTSAILPDSLFKSRAQKAKPVLPGDNHDTIDAPREVIKTPDVQKSAEEEVEEHKEDEEEDEDDEQEESDNVGAEPSQVNEAHPAVIKQPGSLEGRTEIPDSDTDSEDELTSSEKQPSTPLRWQGFDVDDTIGAHCGRKARGQSHEREESPRHDNSVFEDEDIRVHHQPGRRAPPSKRTHNPAIRSSKKNIDPEIDSFIHAARKRIEDVEPVDDDVVSVFSKPDDDEDEEFQPRQEPHMQIDKSVLDVPPETRGMIWQLQSTAEERALYEFRLKTTRPQVIMPPLYIQLSQGYTRVDCDTLSET